MAKIDLKSLSLSELKSLRTRVDKAIERHDKRERSKALASLRAQAKSMGFSLEDLTGAAKPKASKNAAKGKKPSKPTHRHPEDASLTWGGRGARPKWLKDELAKGKSLEDFKI